ncbi:MULTISPECIES: alpha/beta fold hydrolase [unclassified Kitasatospora]|uniref:alpha/beta fold hydrolase n=1 Tax=unclassified Kitasatospora TaxID=2633591 RepID=UPI000709CD80|nr:MULTISPECIES: alpha/beta hydrolase [unclassified Kitasatospora]KQV05555.1 alpha/beta hydrolase [Kitasatospora sp. Root107]KRB62357.1 alpha/beta hydrolase [Kitasatospora sp. Root187]
MSTFSAPDGTSLTCHHSGQGAPLVCLPGGPMRDSAYFGDLGGLDVHRSLIRLDLRGTGDSEPSADPAGYRCDRQVDDVEALRKELGLDTFDLLAHSAGADLAVLYAARYPARVGRLLLVTPAAGALGLAEGPDDRAEAAELTAGEPWHPAALAALAATRQGVFDFEAFAPLIYGRWGAAEQDHVARRATQAHPELGGRYYAEGAFDPEATRAALAALTAPVLVLAGAYDGSPNPAFAARIAAAFPAGESSVLPAIGHFPWVGESAGFVGAVREFLDR